MKFSHIECVLAGNSLRRWPRTCLYVSCHSLYMPFPSTLQLLWRPRRGHHERMPLIGFYYYYFIFLLSMLLGKVQPIRYYWKTISSSRLNLEKLSIQFLCPEIGWFPKDIHIQHLTPTIVPHNFIKWNVAFHLEFPFGPKI